MPFVNVTTAPLLKSFARVPVSELAEESTPVGQPAVAGQKVNAPALAFAAVLSHSELWRTRLPFVSLVTAELPLQILSQYSFFAITNCGQNIFCDTTHRVLLPSGLLRGPLSFPGRA